MPCNLKRIADLPIREEYKIAFLEYFQKPENLAACEEFSNASDEEIMALLGDMEQTIGPPGTQGQQPAPQQPPPVPPGGQGIASMQQSTGPQMPPSPAVAPGIAPSQLADTPMPMDTPVGGINRIPPRGR